MRLIPGFARSLCGVWVSFLFIVLYSLKVEDFDESYYYGMDYNYDLTDRISCNLGVILSEFYSYSQYTSGELTEFAVFQCTLHYNLF